MADQVVQVLPDSTGKSIDVTELTTDEQITVERQRINISDPNDPNQHAGVAAGRVQVSEEYGSQILQELKKIRLGIDILVEHLTK